MIGDRTSAPKLRSIILLCISLSLTLTGCLDYNTELGELSASDSSTLGKSTPDGDLDIASKLPPENLPPIHNQYGTWAGFPGPSEPSAIQVPPPVDPIPMPDSAINIIVLGSDTRPGFYGNRTDTIMIISLDHNSNRVRMISIPRDLYVFIPGWRVNRINTADQHGGIDVVSMTILYNLGIEAHHWVRVSFDGFIQAIDTLGGIDVEVPETLIDECDEQEVSYPAGLNHMDGYTALCYARVRKTSDDFARTKRQQQVVIAVFNKILSVGGISQVPELYGQFGDYVESDISIGDVLQLLPLAASIASDSSRVTGHTIDRTMVTTWKIPTTGASVLLPNYEAIEASLIQIFSE